MGVSSPLSSLGVGEYIMDNRKLFGGAIEAQIPSRFIDVSDFRPVPDHQEVFSDEAADQSIIIEIVELSQTAEECPGRFYLKDLAAVNGAIEWAETSECEELGVSDSVPRLGGGEVASARVFCITGAMVVDTSHGEEGKRHGVEVVLGVVRLPDRDTDVLISLNTPPGSGGQDVFHGILASFHITDWGLFG